MSYDLTPVGSGGNVTVGATINGHATLQCPDAYAGLSNAAGPFFANLPRVLAAVVKLASTGEDAWIAGQEANGSVYGSQFTLFAEGGYWVADCYGGGYSITSAAAIDTALHVLALVYDGTTCTLYVDGASVGSFVADLEADPTQGFTVGYQPGYPRWLNGALGDVVCLGGVPADLAGFLASLANRWSGADSFDPTAWGVPCLLWLDPTRNVTVVSSAVTQWQDEIYNPISIITTTADGPLTSTATWAGGVLPSSTSVAVIANNCTMTAGDVCSYQSLSFSGAGTLTATGGHLSVATGVALAAASIFVNDGETWIAIPTLTVSGVPAGGIQVFSLSMPGGLFDGGVPAKLHFTGDVVSSGGAGILAGPGSVLWATGDGFVSGDGQAYSINPQWPGSCDSGAYFSGYTGAIAYLTGNYTGQDASAGIECDVGGFVDVSGNVTGDQTADNGDGPAYAACGLWIADGGVAILRGAVASTGSGAGKSPLYNEGVLFSMFGANLGQSVGSVVGVNYKIPAVTDVRDGVGVLDGTGTASVLGSPIVSAADVLLGVDRGDGVLGSLVCPSPNDVRFGTAVQNTTGLCYVPTPAETLFGVQVDVSGIGTLGAVQLAGLGPIDPTTGNMLLVIGDDYLAAINRAIQFTDPQDGTWPATIGSALLTVRQAGNDLGTQLLITGGLVSGSSPRVLRFEAPHATTAGMTRSSTPGDNRYAVTCYSAADLAGDVVTVLNGLPATIQAPLAE